LPNTRAVGLAQWRIRPFLNGFPLRCGIRGDREHDPHGRDGERPGGVTTRGGDAGPASEAIASRMAFFPIAMDRLFFPAPERGGAGDPRGLLSEIAAWHGRPLNYASLSRRLGMTRRRLVAEVEQLRRARVVRLLPAVGDQTGKRGIQAPVLYLRTPSDLPFLPPLSAQLLFRGALIEHLIVREELRCPSSRAGHASTRAATHAALVLATPRARVGFQFPVEPVPSRWRWTGLKKCIRAGSLDFGYVLYPGRRVFFTYRGLVTVPVGDFLDDYAAWMEAAEEPRSWRVHEMAGVRNRFAFRRDDPVAPPQAPPAFD
jgi:hypothetical protein